MEISIKTPIKSFRLFLSALILCALAACGGGNDASSSGTTATPTTSEAAPATTPTESRVSSPNDPQTGTASVSKMEIGKIYCVQCSSCHVPTNINLSFCPHRTN